MGITKHETPKGQLRTEAFCDLCLESLGSSVIEKSEYPSWHKQTVALLTFNVNGTPSLLCWDCLQEHGHTKEYDRRLNQLTYGTKAKS